MVLPATTTLRPGDALQSKPKQAMFVRMSSESLDALDSQSTLRFQLGDTPVRFLSS
jgi:RNA polymerase II elongation factor ELL